MFPLAEILNVMYAERKTERKEEEKKEKGRKRERKGFSEQVMKCKKLPCVTSCPCELLCTVFI